MTPPINTSDAPQKPLPGAAAMRESFQAVLDGLRTAAPNAETGGGDAYDGDHIPEDPPSPPESPQAARDAIPKVLLKRAALDTNDLGLATRWEHYSQGKALFCSAIGWMAFDGTRFQAEDGGALAKQNLLRQIEKIKFEEYPALRKMAPTLLEVELGRGTKSERDKYLGMATRLRKAAVTLGNSNKTNAVMQQAAARPKFLVKFEELDGRPGEINTAGGVIALPLDPPPDLDPETREDRIIDARAALTVRPHAVADKFTRCAAFTPPLKEPLRGVDPHPVWSAHLKKIQPNPDDRKTLQRILGSCLVTKNDQNHWFVFQGRGGDGKSVTLHIIRHILGDYVRSADVKSFLHDSRANAAGPREDLMRLAGGTRMVIVAEPEVGAQLSTSTIKLMTGGEEISTRGGHKAQIEFEPQFKLIMMCNEPPKVKGDDEGTWRRPLMVRFPVRIPKKDIDPFIKEKLEAEAPQIFAWLLEGYLDWWARGFDYAASDNIQNTTKSWRRESSQFAGWFEDRIIAGRWFDREAGRRDERLLWEAMTVQQDEEAMIRCQEMFLTGDAQTAKPPQYTPSQIYDDFCAWAAVQALDPWKKQTFSYKWASKARDMNIHKKRVQGENNYFGFDFVDATPRAPGSGGDNPYENYQ